MTTPNGELAYKVLDYITEFPEQHDQSAYVRHYDPDGRPGPECGTVACFAGWTCFLSGDALRVGNTVEVNQKLVHVHERAERLLGLNRDQADDMFIETQKVDEMFAVVAEIFGPRPGGDSDPACGYPLPHPAHDFANPAEERDGEFGPTRQCAGVGGDSDAPR